MWTNMKLQHSEFTIHIRNWPVKVIDPKLIFWEDEVLLSILVP
jgi:hypothetical protein